MMRHMMHGQQGIPAVAEEGSDPVGEEVEPELPREQSCERERERERVCV